MMVDPEYLDALMVARDRHPEMDLQQRHIYSMALVHIWSGVPTDVVFDKETMQPVVIEGKVMKK